MRTLVPFALTAATALAPLGAQQQDPEGAAIPRNLTAAEAAWLAAHPLVGTDVPTPPPTGPLHCAAEYEPMGEQPAVKSTKPYGGSTKFAPRAGRRR